MNQRFVVTEQETIEQRKIRTGANDGKYIEVLEGLKAGEIVINHTETSLSDRTPVNVTLEDEKAVGVGLILDSAGVVNISHAQSGKLHTLMVKTGDFVHKRKLIARIDQPAQTADTQMTRYSIDLAINARDAEQSVHQYNAKRQQEIT